MAKVSVLVPVYNVEKYIRRCAESLFLQTLNDIEYIFVNDAATDNSIKILEEVADKYPNRNVKIIHHQKNKGLASARRTAFENATGEYWACCDSDDWVDLDMYQTLYDAAIKEDADIICSDIFTETNDGFKVISYGEWTECESSILNPNYYGWIYGAIWNKLVKADLYKKNSILPWEGINMWEDSCLTMRLRLLSSKTIIVRKPFYHYNLQNQGSITNTFSIGKIEQMVLATKLMSDFLNAGGYKAKDLIHYLKIMSTETLLRYPTEENIYYWRNIFPEKKHYICSYRNWNIILKIRGMFIAYLPFKMAMFIAKYMRK